MMKLIIFFIVTVVAVGCGAGRVKRQFFPNSDEFFTGPRYPTQNFPNQGQFFPGNQGFNQGFPGNQGFQGFPNQGFPNQGNQGNQGFPNQGNQGQGFPNQGNQGQGFPNQGNQGNQGNQRPPTNQFTTTQAPAPTAAPTTLSPQMEQCRDACVARTTGQYNPVCGTDGTNYHNQARLDCARECGSTVARRAAGVCPTMNAQPQ